MAIRLTPVKRAGVDRLANSGRIERADRCVLHRPALTKHDPDERITNG